MFQRVSILMAALALLLVTGCSKAPETEMKDSEASLESARMAEAEQYAPQSYQMAMDTLNAAMAAKQEQDSKFSLFRGYGKSKEMFLSAQRLAEKAVSDAEREKENTRQLVVNLMAQTQAVVDAAAQALEKAPAGKGTKADIMLIKNDLAAATTGMQEAKTDFDAGKFLAAKAKLEAVGDKARGVMNQIEAALAKKKG
nr:DUF4398 domain-containing protein [candidate division Zixibacteria bacterium]